MTNAIKEKRENVCVVSFRFILERYTKSGWQDFFPLQIEKVWVLSKVGLKLSKKKLSAQLSKKIDM